MYLLMARYTRPIEEVDALLEEHKAWIGSNSDKILLTAREEPLIGGLILARGDSLDEVWEMIRQDPFHASGMAEYEVREYNPVRAAEGVEGLIGT
ncbi:MAG TPA: YciI family protein [Miltoncostaeaceae bacterium]|nr:YciI family protein [Miltoncostaeaceae bacterium]